MEAVGVPVLPDVCDVEVAGQEVGQQLHGGLWHMNYNDNHKVEIIDLAGSQGIPWLIRAI